jgi:hypothetical protein
MLPEHYSCRAASTVSRRAAMDRADWPQSSLDPASDKIGALMSDLARFCRRLCAALALAALAAGGAAVAAQAEYGEIGRFGAAGVGEGQFETNEDATFGVNPINNDIYVVDLWKPEKNEFRIQRFDPNSKGEYPSKPTATTTFKPVDEELNEEESDEVSNVAVDPEKSRIYVLASEERPERNKQGKALIDGGEYAAAQLWSFNVEGEGLVATNGKKALAGTKVLDPLGEKPSEFLMDPDGIAVDPTTHDVILLGEEERGEKKAVDALERITETGDLAEGRWSDKTTTEEPEGFLEDEADSPVVTKNGEVLVIHPNAIDEIDKIPATFSSEGKPTPVYAANPEVENSEGELEPPPVLEELTSFPSTSDEEPHGGGLLSLGSDGTLYARAGIKEQDPELHKGSLGGPEFPGVLLFSSAAGAQKEWSEEGWTGGQSVASVGKEGHCKISIDVYSQVAAGSEHNVFVFDENPTSPRIVEFGPGGKDCPKGRVSAPVASTLSSGGKPIAEDEPIPMEEAITLSSKLVESNALSVEWEFGDGTTASVKTDEHQTTAVEHTFVEGGELQVTEKIHTDDLAEPELVTHSKILIEGSPPVVLAKPATEITTTTATLKATVNPEDSKVTECKFEYGPTMTYGKTAPCASLPGSGNKPVEVSAAITGLAAATKYDVKVVATAKVSGTGQATTSFETVAATASKPAVSVEAATGVTQTTATLNGKVTPDGAEVTACSFEYGTSLPGKPASCAPSTIAAGASATAVSAALTGLTPNTTYKVKLTATNSLGTTESSTIEFTTLATSKPAVTVEAATGITQTTATLNGKVTPDGAEVTACSFEYNGTSASCSPSTIAAGGSATAVSAALSGLTPSTTYRVKLTATNSVGTTESTTIEFVTAAEPAKEPAKETTKELFTPPPGGGVLPFHEASATVAVASRSVTVSSAGAFTLKLQCPAGATSCTGTVTLKTPKAVVARVAHAAKKRKAQILTLATASFTIAGDQVKSVTLHLSSTARTLLAHSHELSALATIVARNAADESATTKASLTLRSAKGAKKR